MAGVQRTPEEIKAMVAAIRARKAAAASPAGPSTIPRPAPSAPEEPRHINTAYDSIQEVVVGKRASATWSDTKLGEVPCYDVRQTGAANALALGKMMVTSISSNTANPTTADICLTLAISIPKPGVTNWEPLLEPLPPTVGARMPFTVPTAVSGEASVAAKKRLALNRAAYERETDEAKKAQIAIVIKGLEDQEKGLDVSSSSTTRSEGDATSYCFLAACLLKLFAKSPESLLNSVPVIKTRFAAWYEGTPVALEEVALTQNNLTALRMIFARRPELAGTWTLWVSHTENKSTPLLSTHQGLLNYLACQQFSYLGMHAYSLIIDIHEKTGMKFGELLRNLDAPTTRAGLRAVFEIIRDLEVTADFPARKTYFRYARSWDPKYFSALQSTNCKALVYVAASVNKKISTQGTVGDPLEIYAIKDMDPTLRDRLEAVAVRLTNKILDQMLIDEISGDAWKG